MAILPSFFGLTRTKKPQRTVVSFLLGCDEVTNVNLFGVFRSSFRESETNLERNNNDRDNFPF